MILVSCAILELAVCASSQSPEESHSKVEIIAERNPTHLDRPSWVGLLFHLDKGWHIYWQNPGDSGEPPKVQWQLPPGLVAGAIQWPPPMRLGGGTVVDYGYEGQVLLIAAITGAAKGNARLISGI